MMTINSEQDVVASLIDEIHRLKQQNQKLSKDIESLKGQVSDLKWDKDNLQRRNDNLSHLSDEMEHKIDNIFDDSGKFVDYVNVYRQYRQVVEWCKDFQKSNDRLRKCCWYFEGLLGLAKRFPLVVDHNWHGMENAWNKVVNTDEWVIYLIGGRRYDNGLPLVKVGRAQNLAERCKLYDELANVSYNKSGLEIGKKNGKSYFDHTPGYQIPLGLLKASDIGIKTIKDDKVAYRSVWPVLEAIFRTVFQHEFSTENINDSHRTEYFQSHDKNLYRNSVKLFNKVAKWLESLDTQKLKSFLENTSRQKVYGVMRSRDKNYQHGLITMKKWVNEEIEAM